jgi:hypothetical protein
MKISAFEQRARRTHARHLTAACALFAGAWLTTLPAAAQPIDDATRNAARELAVQAADAFTKGDYAKAHDLYHRAYSLIPAPTLSLREARSLEKLGRWVEAVEAYVRTTRVALGPDAPEAYRQAVHDAHDGLAKLRPRVPKLKVVLRGGDPGDTSVSLNGKPMKSALIGVDQPVNPGTHELVASGNGKRGTARVQLSEGERKSIELELSDDPSATPVPASALEAASGADETRGDSGPTEAGGSPQAALGWVGVGVGAAGLGVGVVTGLMATSKHSSAREGCPDGVCPEGSQAADDLDAFRSLRTISTIGYAVGIVGVAAGVTLLLTAPARADSARVTPFVGVGRAGLLGWF